MEPLSSQNIIGKQLGQYKIETQIGQGGMATVYKAYQPSINRHVAVKILPSQYAQDPNFVKRFEHEARAIAALEHPHILPVYDFGSQDGLTYMAMRYVETGTLSNLMGSPLSNERIVRLIGPVARALDYAHKQGVVHRDIKPSNILIDQNGEPLLTDFGIAKMIQGSGATQLTGTGMVLGTPAYMSPEQAKGISIDGRSDIYSLGVVLYELLTGQQPYQAETPLGVVFKHVSEPLPPPRSINPKVAEPLERVVIKAMAKEPAQRYLTAGEMEQALQSALREIESGERTMSSPALSTPPQGVPVSTTLPSTSPQKPRSKLGLWLGVGAAVVCLGGCGLLALGIAVAPTESGTPTTVAEVTPTRKAVSIGIEKTATPTPTPTEVEASPTPSEVEATPTPPETEPVATDEPTPETSPTDESYVNATDGEILFKDSFDNNNNDWPTERKDDEYGSSNSELVDGSYQMSQKAKQGVFTWNSLNQTDFDNFALSVEATPVEHNNLFAYGLTFREDTDFGDLYIFEVDTDGYYGISKRKDGKWETLAKWTKLEAIKPEGPNELMVKTAGPVLSFYVNGTEATTLLDDSRESGSIGLALDMFEKGDTATARFDNLLVQPLSPEDEILLAALEASLTLQQTTLDNPENFYFEDTFDSDINGWATGKFKDDFSDNEVKIEDGKYSLSVQDKDSAFVNKTLPNQEFDDFVLEIEATPLDTNTSYSYGISFREKGGSFYAFEIGNDGQFAVLLYDGSEWKRLKDWSTSEAIKVGEINKIKLEAQDDTLTFYVNDQPLTTVQNDVSLSGKVGPLIAVFEKGTAAKVEFDNLIITPSN